MGRDEGLPGRGVTGSDIGYVGAFVPRRGVLELDVGDEQPQPLVDALDRNRESAGQRPAGADQPTGELPGVVAKQLDVVAAGNIDVDAGGSTVRCQLQVGDDVLPLDRLVPRNPPGRADSELVGGLEMVGARDRPLHAAPLHLQEAEDHVHPGAVVGQHECLGEHRRALSDPASLGADRTNHAELPPDLVLARRRAIGVQQVALVEHGVGDPTGRIDAAHHVTAGLAASSSSA